MSIKFNGLPIRRVIMFVIMMGVWAIGYKYIAPYMNVENGVRLPVHGLLRVAMGFFAACLLAMGSVIVLGIIGVAGIAIPSIPKVLFKAIDYILGIEISFKWYDEFLIKWEEIWESIIMSIIGFIMFME